MQCSVPHPKLSRGCQSANLRTEATDYGFLTPRLPAGKPELKQHLQRYSAKPYTERLADFHLLLFLARQPNFDLTGGAAPKLCFQEGPSAEESCKS